MTKVQFKGIVKTVIFSAAILLLNGCAREISSNVYEADHVGEAAITYPGVIVSARAINVQDKERLEENGMGIVGGGLAGGLAGSQFGKGDGNTAATIGGALLGATAGAFAEKALKSQSGMEYTVALDNGQTTTVVQGPQPTLSVGQNVYVMVYQKGRSRVVPR